MDEKRKPDTELAKVIRDLQNEIDSKAVILKALREQYDHNEIDYYEYLKTEAWQEQRAKIFRRDGFQCVCCGSAKNLEVHHITYKNLGAEEKSDLVTLCGDCHEKVHSGEMLKSFDKEPDQLVGEHENRKLLLHALAMGKDAYKNIKFKIHDDELPFGLDLKIGSLDEGENLEDFYGKFRWFFENFDEVAAIAKDARDMKNDRFFYGPLTKFEGEKVIIDMYYWHLLRVREESYHITADYLLDLKYPKASPEEQEAIKKELADLEEELKEIRQLAGDL